MAVEVAVTFIRNQDKLLLIYNEKWGAYTLPMTKRRILEDAKAADAGEAEEWLDAAARPVVECLGRPGCPEKILEDFLPEEHFSLRASAMRLYKYKVFQELLRDSDQVVARTPWVWLTRDEIRSGRFRPISPTAIEMVAYDEIFEALNL